MENKIQFEEHICKICGRVVRKLGNHLISHNMVVKEYYDMYFKKDNEGKCLVCGKDTKFYKFNYGYQMYCSKECQIKGSIEKFGSYNNRSKAITTCVQKFDGKMNSGAWDTRKSNIEQFEKEHNCTSTEKLLRLYGGGWKALNLPKIMINKQNSAISNEYLPQIIEYSNTYHNSLVQQHIIDFIKYFYFDDIITNDRQVIKPNELDIVLPKLKLAIEFNGTRWHSIELGTAKEYHLSKSLACRNVGFRLVHIYEFEDLDEQLKLLKEFILGQDNYPKNFNKNNFLETIPTPEIIYKDSKYTIYGAGKMEGI